MRTTQFGWQVCSKCGGLFFTGRRPVPGCKAGGQHATSGNTNRGILNVPTLTENLPDREEGNWRFCTNCHGLFRIKGDADMVDHGICNHAKNGTAHVAEPDSAIYILQVTAGSPVTAADKATAYYECSKCGGLYHNWNKTYCNAGGAHTRQTYDLSGRTSGERYYLLAAK